MSPYLNPHVKGPPCQMCLTESNLTQIGKHGPLRSESGMRYHTVSCRRAGAAKRQ